QVFERTVSGESQQYTVRVKKANGDWLTLSVNTTPLRHGEEIVGTVSFGRDITERERAERALRAIVEGTASATGADFFRSLVRSLASALDVRWAHVAEVGDGDADKVRTLAVWSDEGFGENFEYDLAGAPCQGVVGQRQRCYASGVRAQFPQDRLLAEMGVESYLGTPLFDAAGAALGLLVVMDDEPMSEAAGAESIAAVFASRAAAELERIRSVEILRRSEAHYRSLVDGMPHGIYRSTEAGRFLSCNPALAVMLGYASEAELLRVDIATDVYQDPAQRERLIEERRERDVIEPLDAGWKRKDGTPITVRLSGRVVREPGGAILCFEMSAEDVTERRALENQLRQAQKMEAVGQFAGGIAHDFNNLLATVLTTAELMSDECAEGSQLGEDIRTIQHAALSGAELTRRLLAFGRRQQLELRPVDLTEVVRGFAKAARRLVREDIEIGIVLDQPVATVRADPSALEQILMNLVTNARDAIPESGSLVIQTGRATLDQEFCDTQGWGIPGEYVALTVTDTGIGMDDETRRRVFEPFFTTKPVGVGTGLGMAVVYGLAKEHRGYVQISSEVGHGTMVRVYLPAVLDGAEGLVSPAPIVPVRGGTETILLVEDADSLRRAGTRVLVKNGYTVLSAADGLEALDLFQAHEKEIALVVTDVVMPRLGGPRLWAELKRQGISVKFLFTSGYAARDVEEAKSLELGMPFLSKPWSAPDLLRRVREVLDAPAVA
ncbi:MAG: PAS domain S-box protein, partial [Gemmatimonadota bacterium]